MNTSDKSCNSFSNHVNSVKNPSENEREKDVIVNVAISNVRGLRSKARAIENIASKEPFNFLLISETQIPVAERPSSRGYLTHFHRNRNPKEGSSRAKGGVSIAAGPEDSDHCTVIGKGDSGREFISVKSTRFSPGLCLYSYYGRQEGKVTDSEITNTLTELFCKGRWNADQGDVVIIGGDFNVHVGHLFGLEYNDAKISRGGADLERIAKEYGFQMMNSRARTDDHTTHKDETSKVKRALDFLFINVEAAEKVESVHMDSWEDPQYTPYRVLRPKKNKVVRRYTDHRTLWMRIRLQKNMKAKVRDEITRWRVTPDGLSEYYGMTEKYAESVVEMAQDEDCDIEEVVEHVYKVMETCKEESYDKVTRSKAKWKELDDEVEISNYSKQLSKEVSKDRMKYKYNAKLRTYAARKRLLMEQRGDAPFALQKEDGSMAVTYEERAETLAEYNRKLLGRNPHPGEEGEEFERRKKVVKEYLENNRDFRFESEINEEDFMWAVDRIAEKKKPMFNDFIRSHPKMKAALYWVVRRLYKEEKTPERFLETELIPLFKGKGSPADPAGYRYLHLKSWGARLLELCIFRKIEEFFDVKTPEVQLGGMKERSTLYHLLAVNETARKAFQQGGGVVVTLVDCKKMFDCVWLEDITYEMCIEKIDPKAMRNLFNFSYVNILHVQGSKSQWFIIPAGVGQGSVSGARGCSFLVAKRLDNLMDLHPDPLMNAEVKMTGNAFVDDVLGMDKNADGSYVTTEIFTKMLNSMGLEAHEKKSVVIICGTNKYVVNTMKDFDKKKARIQGHELDVVKEDAYLGIMVCEGSPSAQVWCNINMKRRKVAGKLQEILPTLRKYEVRLTGNLNSVSTLVEGVIRPAMTYGMETLKVFNKGQRKAFNQIWKTAVTRMINVPDNVTSAALYLLLNILPCYEYIIYFKIILIMSIFQRRGSRIYNILREQYVCQETGCIVEDTLTLCKYYGLPDVIAGPVVKEYVRDKIFEKTTARLTWENNQVKCLPYINFTTSQDMSHMHYPRRMARAYTCYRLGLLRWLTRRKSESLQKYGTIDCPCRTPQCVEAGAKDELEHAIVCDGYKAKHSQKSHDPKWELSRYSVELCAERERRWPWLPSLIYYSDSKPEADMSKEEKKKKPKPDKVQPSEKKRKQRGKSADPKNKNKSKSTTNQNQDITDLHNPFGKMGTAGCAGNNGCRGGCCRRESFRKEQENAAQKHADPTEGGDNNREETTSGKENCPKSAKDSKTQPDEDQETRSRTGTNAGESDGDRQASKGILEVHADKAEDRRGDAGSDGGLSKPGEESRERTQGPERDGRGQNSSFRRLDPENGLLQCRSTVVWREEAGMEGRGFPPKDEGNGETCKTHEQGGRIEEGRRPASDDMERCGQIPQPSDLRILGRNGKGKEVDEAKKAKEGLHHGGPGGGKNPKLHDPGRRKERERNVESKEMEERIDGEMEERKGNLPHEVPERTEVEEEKKTLDRECSKGDELQTTDTEVEGEGKKTDELGEGGKNHGESKRKFSERGISLERVGLEEGCCEKIPLEEAVMGSEIDDRNYREESPVSEPMKQLELPSSQIIQNLKQQFVTNPIMSLQSTCDSENLAKANPKKPVNLCTKESFNSDEPSITKHTSKVYKEGETLNDTKASGVNDIITYDTSCIYDNDNNNVIL